MYHQGFSGCTEKLPVYIKPDLNKCLENSSYVDKELNQSRPYNFTYQPFFQEDNGDWEKFQQSTINDTQLKKMILALRDNWISM